MFKFFKIFSIALVISSSFFCNDVSFEHLPRWRGFNLLEKFNKDWSNKPFVEEDFKMIQELGFDFVRLPMDYRVWIKDNDPNVFNEEVFKEIDQAVEWGKKYGVHVCINFHRAPGYCVNEKVKEKNDLWTDTETQKLCAKHWAKFAERYKGIPNKELSFNLFNEPPVLDDGVYFKVVKIMAEAIREKDPNRLIIADGVAWGAKPDMKLVSLKVAQSTRGYFPFNISHYKASWVEGANRMAVPVWPMPKTDSYIYGPVKKDFKTPVRIEGDLKKAAILRIKIDTVSDFSRLVVRSDGKQVWDKTLKCGPGKGEWEKDVFKKEWNVYQNIYNKDYYIDIPAGTKTIEIENIEGDWMTFSLIGLRNADETNEYTLSPFKSQWGKKQEPVVFDPSNKTLPFKTTETADRKWLWNEFIVPFQNLEAEGSGVIVGEWGVYNRTPHDVTLKWMQDCLTNWKKVGWGWSMWNFRGEFGILDSERKDVKYEDFHGHKLDRKMLELLKEY